MNRRLFAGAGLLVAACGGSRSASRGPEPRDSVSVAQFLDATPVYQGLGRLAAGPPLPFVGSVSFVAGPGDTTIVVIALSFENRALSFQPSGQEYVARYHVDLTVRPAGGETPLDVGKDESVRVSDVREAQRAGESIFFQQTFHLVPGSYHVQAAVRDRNSPNQGRAEQDITVPALPAGTTSPPVLVYEVKNRLRREDPLSVIVNPRGLITNGGDTLLAYVEAYRLGESAVAVPFELRDARDSVILHDSLRFQGGRDVESKVLRLSPNSAPLGGLTLAVGAGDQRRTVRILSSISQHLVLTDYDQMLDLLRYFTVSARLDSLRAAPPAERPQRWQEFMRATDPDSTTEQNEALNEYFSRLIAANARFRQEGIPGWRTDRGEVYITLGDPDEVLETPVTQVRLIRWTYTRYRLFVYFEDSSGLGRFRMTNTSRSEFERVARTVRQGGPEGGVAH